MNFTDIYEYRDGQPKFQDNITRIDEILPLSFSANHLANTLESLYCTHDTDMNLMNNIPE